MSFLQQLKHRANEVQESRGQDVRRVDENVDLTEAACRTVWQYLSELATQLNILQPPARALSLDGRTAWPTMKLTDFRFDARRKILGSREVTEHLALGWRVTPVHPGDSAQGLVSVNFPTDLQRVEERLRGGQIKFNRVEERHPESNKLLAVKFEHDMAARGSVVFTPDHASATVQCRLQGVIAFQIQTLDLPVQGLTTGRLDELARAIVGESDLFI